MSNTNGEPLFRVLLGEKWSSGLGSLIMVEIESSGQRSRIFALRFEKVDGVNIWQPDMSPHYYSPATVSHWAAGDSGLVQMVKSSVALAQQEYPNG